MNEEGGKGTKIRYYSGFSLPRWETREGRRRGERKARFPANQILSFPPHLSKTKALFGSQIQSDTAEASFRCCVVWQLLFFITSSHKWEKRVRCCFYYSNPSRLCCEKEWLIKSIREERRKKKEDGGGETKTKTKEEENEEIDAIRMIRQIPERERGKTVAAREERKKKEGSSTASVLSQSFLKYEEERKSFLLYIVSNACCSGD